LVTNRDRPYDGRGSERESGSKSDCGREWEEERAIVHFRSGVVDPPTLRFVSRPAVRRSPGTVGRHGDPVADEYPSGNIPYPDGFEEGWILVADERSKDVTVERVAVTLHHVHLPKMDDVSVVDYDPDESLVVTADTP
jgi:hypothetical protein